MNSLTVAGRRVACVLFLLIWTAGAAGLAQAESGDDSPKNSPRSYTVGIEDVLRIVVWGEPDLSGSIQVRPDGMITVALIHDVYVDGLTPEEIRTEISRRLAEFIRDPNVTVIVETINSYRIFFLGEVNKQGVIQLFKPMRILQATAMGGGPGEFSKKIITLIREEYGVEKRVEIDYKKLLAGSPEQENIYLKPGDTLIFK